MMWHDVDESKEVKYSSFQREYNTPLDWYVWLWHCPVQHGNGNKFSFFFQQAFTIMDQNRDGFIDKADLRDTFAALGKLAVIIKYLKEMQFKFQAHKKSLY